MPSTAGWVPLVGAALLWVSSLLPLPLADIPTALCDGHAATISGTAGDDFLIGTAGDDVIVGGDGDDIIDAREGNDLVCAGPGDDTLIGGAGHDTLLGQAGDDTLLGRAGDDTLNGGSDTNLLVGGSGDDLLLGGPGDDTLKGNLGDDRLYGQGGCDTLRGGQGNDLLLGGPGDDLLTGGSGADEMHGAPGADRLRGQAGPDHLFGEAGDDLLLGGDGDDTLRGHDGRDWCDGGEGRDDAAACEEFTGTEVGQVPQPVFRPGPGQVALTFDDGPSPIYTDQILDILEHYGVPATFFVIGRQVVDNPALLRRMATAGHSVQNHTWGHYWLTRYSDATITDQLQRADEIITQVTGETPHCYRPPFGAVNDRVRSVAADLGLTTIMWDVDPWDWKHPGATAVASHVLSRTGEGDIVLFHDTAGWSTIGALPSIIEGLRARGLDFVTICATPPPATRPSRADPADAFGQV